jgi:hypothetical protein
MDYYIQQQSGDSVKGEKVFYRLFSALYKSMTEMNTLLSDKVVQNAVWKKLCLTAPLPSFDATAGKRDGGGTIFNSDFGCTIWHGTFSDWREVTPSLHSVYINEAHEDRYYFFDELNRKGFLRDEPEIVSFNEEQAALGRALLAIERKASAR